MLLVEDDDKSAKLVMLALKRASCHVQWSRDAHAAALLLLAGLRPTVILLDLDLPGPTGLDLARFIKASPELRAAPVIAVTASGPSFGKSAARSAGCDGYLAKPIDVLSLAAWIGEHVRGAS